MEDIQGYQKPAENCQVIKPTIVPSLLLLQSSIIAITILIFFGSFLLPLGILLVVSFGLIGFFIGLVIFIIVFGSILAGTYHFTKMSLLKTEYRFYYSRVEYFEGFLVKNRKTVNYDRISNVGQRKGILEGRFNLGTIFIDTAGYSAKGHEIAMTNLKNPDKIYDWILKVTSKK